LADGLDARHDRVVVFLCSGSFLLGGLVLEDLLGDAVVLVVGLLHDLFDEFGEALRFLDRDPGVATPALTGHLAPAEGATVRGECPVFSSGQAMNPKFPLGKITIKEEAACAPSLAGQDASFFLDKHARGTTARGTTPGTGGVARRGHGHCLAGCDSASTFSRAAGSTGLTMC
jgi:hypothetical protein